MTPIMDSCPVCGGTQFAQGRVLSAGLIAAWGLDSAEEAAIERQQACHCSLCGCNLRSMTLASALMRHFQYDGVFEDFCRAHARFRSQRILEFNEAGSLHPWLKLAPFHELVSYPAMDMQAMSLADGSRDVVLHSDTLEHVPDAAAALRECHRVLRPGGLLAFTVPLLPGRLTRIPDPENPSHHGLNDTAGEDYRVRTEFGADTWTALVRAGFHHVAMHTLASTDSVAFLAEKDGADALSFTGERLVTSIPPTRRIALEHLHRYAFASQFCAGRRVLDIACGEGYGSALLLAGDAKHVLGVDGDAGVVEHAALKYAAPNLAFRAGRASEIPADAESFDLVVSFETLEHVANQAGFVREIRRVLAPGGILLVSTPDRMQYSGKTGNANPYHTRELDKREFQGLLADSFRHVALLGQRCILGSWICAEAGVSHASGVFETSYEKTSFTRGSGAALYWIAVCSDEPLPTIPTGVAMPEAGILDQWLDAYERLPSPQLVIDYAVHGHLTEPRPRLAERVRELEEKNDAKRRQIDKLKEKLEHARAKAVAAANRRGKLRRLLDRLRGLR